MQWVIDDSLGEPVETELENNYYMDEQQLETLKKLREIGIRDEYYDYVNAEFLEEIVLLPILNEQQCNVLYDDINNLHDGMSFLQEKTNQLLRQLLGENNGILGILL